MWDQASAAAFSGVTCVHGIAFGSPEAITSYQGLVCADFQPELKVESAQAVQVALSLGQVR